MLRALLLVSLWVSPNAFAVAKDPNLTGTPPVTSGGFVDFTPSTPTVGVGRQGSDSCQITDEFALFLLPVGPMFQPNELDQSLEGNQALPDSLQDIVECQNYFERKEMNEEHWRLQLGYDRLNLRLGARYQTDSSSDSALAPFGSPEDWQRLADKCEPPAEDFGTSSATIDLFRPNLNFGSGIELLLNSQRINLPHSGSGSKFSDYANDGPWHFNGDAPLTLPLVDLNLSAGLLSDAYATGANGQLQGRLSYNLSGSSTITDAFSTGWVENFRYMNFGTEAGTDDWAGNALSYNIGGNDTRFDPFGPRRLLRDGNPLDMKVTNETLIGPDLFVTTYVDPNNPDITVLESKIQIDGCYVKLTPVDPHFRQRGIHDGNSWGERFDDQWAIKRVGFSGENSPWSDLERTPGEIVVAIVDSGLDWDHADLDHGNIWQNADEIPGNGIDDDRNGYIDDIIGWDFINKSNRPWDHDGHGTIVAGIIAAAHNDIGIAGINPQAKLMIIKALDNEGRSRASLVAQGIAYAVDNGAKIVNVSVGGDSISVMVQAAIDYANEAGVLIVAASGNEGKSLEGYALADNEGVFTVGATYIDDYPAEFSNFGPQVDIAAPGVEILSLRARLTDTNFVPDATDEYTMGDYIVGDGRYIKASGTSFAAPIVTGVASVVWSLRPNLTAEQVQAVLEKSADDLHVPGKDPKTGHGLVNAQRALTMEPDFKIDVSIDKLNVISSETVDQFELIGTASTDRFKRAWVTIGQGETPRTWKRVGTKLKKPVVNASLMTLSSTEFPETGLWQVVLHVEHANGTVRAFRKPLRLQ